MDDRFGEWKGGQDLLERLPGHATLLASFAERLSPKPDDAVFEGAECPVVEDGFFVPLCAQLLGEVSDRIFSYAAGSTLTVFQTGFSRLAVRISPQYRAMRGCAPHRRRL